jgi:aryl-alcohol dehydrogenase-like predicted oxidoreductase
MRYKKLGFTDLSLSVMGLGAWAFGGEKWSYGWAGQEDQDSISTIHHALDLGMNWIDTAAAYGYGHAEEVVGRAIAGKRDKVFIATKGGLKTGADGWNFECVLKADSLRKEAEDSLKRLKVDVIDLYQIHKPFPDEDIEEGWGVVADLIKEGKVRYGGVSIFSIEQIKRCQAIHPVASYQPPYSMLVRGVEDELLSFCAENQIGVITYSPMRSGLLTGKLTRERLLNMEKEDWRTHADPEFQGKRLEINLALVDGLKPIAERMGCSLSQLAIAWVLRRTEITGTIVGARRPSQLDETIQASDISLTSQDEDEIAALLAERDNALLAAGESLNLPW